MANLTAEQQYYSTYDIVQGQIATLKSRLKENKKNLEFKKKEIGQKINYAHAGDMLRLAKELEDILEHVGTGNQ